MIKKQTIFIEHSDAEGENKIQTICEFGKGDIRVKSGLKNGLGIVSFDNANSPRIIGSKEKNQDQTINQLIRTADVVLKFEKVGSIDVVIEYLLDAKERMESIDNNFKKVVSSNIEAVSYDTKTMKLLIKFKGGNVYSYQDVSQDVCNNFMTSKSIGSYFYHHIKGKYQSEKVEVDKCIK